jgi:hypothetical protein
MGPVQREEPLHQIEVLERAALSFPPPQPPSPGFGWLLPSVKTPVPGGRPGTWRAPSRASGALLSTTPRACGPARPCCPCRPSSARRCLRNLWPRRSGPSSAAASGPGSTWAPSRDTSRGAASGTLNVSAHTSHVNWGIDSRDPASVNGGRGR